MSKVIISYTKKVARGFNYEETGEKIAVEFDCLPEKGDFVRLPGSSSLFLIVCRYFSTEPGYASVTLMVCEDSSIYRTVEYIEEQTKREEEEKERLLQLRAEETKKRSELDLIASQPPKKEPIPETDVFGRVLS